MKENNKEYNNVLWMNEPDNDIYMTGKMDE